MPVIHEAKASAWNSVKTSAIVYDIKHTLKDIDNKITGLDDEQMAELNRTELKKIAAGLETAYRRINYIIHGRY